MEVEEEVGEEVEKESKHARICYCGVSKIIFFANKMLHRSETDREFSLKYLKPAAKSRGSLTKENRLAFDEWPLPSKPRNKRNF